MTATPFAVVGVVVLAVVLTGSDGGDEHEVVLEPISDVGVGLGRSSRDPDD